jgi:hypothetical protein
MSTEITIKICKILDTSKYESECKVSNPFYTGGREDTKVVSMRVKPDAQSMWDAMKTVHAFKTPLKEEDLCKEIVYISTNGDAKLIWRAHTDETWVQFNLKNLQKTKLQTNDIFEIRTY